MYSRIYRPAAYAALAGVSFTWYLHNNADCDGAVQLIAKEGVPYRVVMSGDVGGTNSRLKMFKVDQNAEIKKRERAPGAIEVRSKGDASSRSACSAKLLYCRPAQAPIFSTFLPHGTKRLQQPGVSRVPGCTVLCFSLRVRFYVAFV